MKNPGANKKGISKNAFLTARVVADEREIAAAPVAVKSRARDDNLSVREQREFRAAVDAAVKISPRDAADAKTRIDAAVRIVTNRRKISRGSGVVVTGGDFSVRLYGQGVNLLVTVKIRG